MWPEQKAAVVTGLLLAKAAVLHGLITGGQDYEEERKEGGEEEEKPGGVSVRAPFTNVNVKPGTDRSEKEEDGGSPGMAFRVTAPGTTVTGTPGEGTEIKAPFTSVTGTPGEGLRVVAPFANISVPGMPESGRISATYPGATVTAPPSTDVNAVSNANP